MIVSPHPFWVVSPRSFFAYVVFLLWFHMFFLCFHDCSPQPKNKGRIPHSLLCNILPMVPCPKLKGRIPPEASAEKPSLWVFREVRCLASSHPPVGSLVKTKTECQVESQIMSGCMSGCMSDTMPDEMSDEHMSDRMSVGGDHPKRVFCVLVR